MKIKYYPDKSKVDQAINNNDPLFLLVSFDGETVLISNADDSVEHVILLKQLGYKATDIDSFFRIIANKDGADWTFVCPSNYKGIKDKQHRLETFYADGFAAIRKALNAIGYKGEITIPVRYRRHMDMMGGK